MKFNPITAAKTINDTYRDYMKSTFFIRDEVFRDAYTSSLDIFEFAKGPYLECVHAFVLGKSLKALVDEGVLSPRFEQLFAHDRNQYTRALYKHQEDAMHIALADKNMVVTTGTGSGKTECFTYPILHTLLEEERRGTLCAGVRVLLLYPMNALANDQMQRLRKLLKDYPAITFGSYTGETESSDVKARASYRALYPGQDILPNELISREQMKMAPPHILVTNYAMLEYLLLRPADNVFFDDARFNSHWKLVVLDEAHVYCGASGMEVSILLRRLVHRLPKPNVVRFILTSATLGDETHNQDIVTFASRLCADAPFTIDAVVRATRREIDHKAAFLGDATLYEQVVDVLESEKGDEQQRDSIVQILHANGLHALVIDEQASTQELLYAVFCQDEMYGRIRWAVRHGSIELKALIDFLGVQKEAIIAFILLANHAIRDGGKLLDARYHHFIRTLEGAYITFFPKQTLSLQPRNYELIDGKSYKCFKLSVCQFCGTTYLEGFISNGMFVQEEGERREAFMHISEDFLTFDDDEDVEQVHKKMGKRQKAAYWLCSSCGQTVRYGGVLPCHCDIRSHILLYKCKLAEDQILHQCQHCRTTQPHGSVLRGFYLGQDASAAVIGESLYTQIPAKSVVTERILQTGGDTGRFAPKRMERSSKNSRQLLLFSDSRQEAAYFASYFQNTYDVVFNRRVIMRVARNLLDRDYEYYQEGIPITDLANAMVRYISATLQVAQSIDEVRIQVWTAIIGELMDLSRNSLRGVGWLDYQLGEDDLLEQECAIGKTTISAQQMRVLSLICLQYCMRFGAVHLPEGVQFTSADYQQMVFSMREPAIQETDRGITYANYTLRNFLPTTRNKISDYLDRAFSMEDEGQRELLGAIFNEYLTHPSFRILAPVTGEESLFKVDPSKVRVCVQGYHAFGHYRCDVCGQLTTTNINNICPFYRCSGKLYPHPFDAIRSKGYFINQYGPDAPIIPAVVKEHTAQLSKDRAKEYQRKFIQGEINVLSCTTTFEMGVDVGDLETVFMKNVPPRPSNYVQRAGRAGRRLSTAAFSLTFCKLGPHDFYYFNRPTDMIDGEILPPIFKIDNHKIVGRHVYAVLLSAYWKRLFSENTKIQQFLEPESYRKIVDFLHSVPSEVIDYLQAVLPPSLRGHINVFISEYIAKLYDAQLRYIADVSEYDEAMERAQSVEKTDKYRALDWLSRAKRAYEDENIISYYSRMNLIPKYGFPVDTVTLFTNARASSYADSGSALSLQRDLIQAINEYAPDSEVAADGKLYTSRYVKLPYQKDWAWRLRWVQHCQNQNCGKITVENYTTQDIGRGGVCPVCQDAHVNSQVMLIPEFGFIIDPSVSPISTRRPRRSQRTEFYYLGAQQKHQALDPKEYQLGGKTLSVISSPDDHLLVMNRSQFFVCRECGYAQRYDVDNWAASNKNHNNPRGYPCHSTALDRMSLGHTFKTDVVLISIDEHLVYTHALTTLYALLEGCSRYFDVERDDIDGCISYQGHAGKEAGTSFVLFDSVPGGAGNVKRIYDATKGALLEFLQTALDRATDCTCGGDVGDMVCYNCLANFRNQFHQGVMERRFAIGVLSRLLETDSRQ